MNNNFTTIEQSNRLLELGFPKNSADLYYNKYGALEAIPEYRNFNEFCDYTDTPCWSAGRLIEIYLICNEVVCGVTELHHSAVKIDVREFTIVDYIIRKIENKIKKKGESFLSKLEV